MENRRRKTLSLLVCVGMLCVALVGGTMAYLTDAEGAMSNTFATGDVDIALQEVVGKNDETTETIVVDKDGVATLEGHNYGNVMPGDTLTKKVSVSNEGSEPVIVRVFVTINNADKINKAIDNFYEDKNWPAKDIQAVYDQVFQGWGLNYMVGSSVNGMRCAIDKNLPDGVDHVDSVKTVTDYVRFYNKNWFGETGSKPDYIVGLNGYYADYVNEEAGITAMGENQLRYVYYMQLDPGKMVELFQGLKAPADFTAEQLEMFDGLKIDVSAEAIQAANVAKGTTAGDYMTAFSLYDASNGQNATLVASTDELNKALLNGATTLILSDGTYVMPASAKNKNLTIIGNKNSVIKLQRQGSIEGSPDYSLEGSTVTFKGITIETDGENYAGFVRMNGTYNNCTFEKNYFLYGDSVFNNCTFNVSGDRYNVWTYGAHNATFNGCTFNSSGKALLVYGDIVGKTTIKVNGCTFKDDNAFENVKDKAAIEIGKRYDDDVKEIIVTNATVNGFDINPKGISTGTELWGNKDSLSKQNLNVIVDGVDVY